MFAILDYLPCMSEFWMLLLHACKMLDRAPAMHSVHSKLLICFPGGRFCFISMSIAQAADNKKSFSPVAAAAVGVLAARGMEVGRMTVSLSAMVVMATLLLPLRSRRCGRCVFR